MEQHEEAPLSNTPQMTNATHVPWVLSLSDWSNGRYQVGLSWPNGLFRGSGTPERVPRDHIPPTRLDKMSHHTQG